MKPSELLITAILLIIALIVLPVVAVFYDNPLTEIQLSTLLRLLAIMSAFALLSFIVGELTGNFSQTDKLWSITPFIYTLFTAYSSDWQPRVTLMALLVGVWSIRLTYNFNRRGGYSWKFWTGEEDYRWSVVRQQPFLQGRFRILLFNLFFISFYQHALILAITFPAVLVMETDSTLQLADILLAFLMLSFIVIETIADQQQWNFQQEKHRRIKAGEQLTREQQQGFISSGLWKLVRHPNYAAEQSIWVVFYLFSIAATGRWLNWSMAGCILLILLFHGSANFSEGISAGKYPGYKDYQKKVPRFIPGL